MQIQTANASVDASVSGSRERHSAARLSARRHSTSLASSEHAQHSSRRSSVTVTTVKDDGMTGSKLDSGGSVTSKHVTSNIVVSRGKSYAKSKTVTGIQQQGPVWQTSSESLGYTVLHSHLPSVWESHSSPPPNSSQRSPALRHPSSSDRHIVSRFPSYHTSAEERLVEKLLKAVADGDSVMVSIWIIVMSFWRSLAYYSVRLVPILFDLVITLLL